ncbi:MAG: TauD/TfdA family dioxygenase [Pseudomonadota bacterium]
MTTATLNRAAGTLDITWPDATVAAFPYLWLRDNCPTGLHPDTRERTFDLLSVAEDIAPISASATDGSVTVEWGDHISRFSAQWLKAHRPGKRQPDPADVARVAWRGDAAEDVIPRYDAASLLRDDAALAAFLHAAKVSGLAIVTELRDELDAGMDIARRIGFLRETNFGVTFDVESKPDPNNLAYTSHALPLHTDLPNQEMPPGFQFLHCLANDAEGGGSVFCDGLAVAEDIRRDDPDAFELLATELIPLRFHDATTDIRTHDTVIRLGHDGRVAEVRFNGHIAGVFDLATDKLAPYYSAYRKFMALSRSDAYRTTLRLGGGEMVVFDNRRVLHGRDAFDPSTGYRRLRGCYVDRGEWDSRMRVLARNAAAPKE